MLSVPGIDVDHLGHQAAAPLRQYLPRALTDPCTPRGGLFAIATELNARPRKTVGGSAPAQAMQRLLFEPQPPIGTTTRLGASPTVSQVALFAEFTDPRLVALYDTLHPFAEDTVFYIELAEELNASTIIDIGCGTGLLTCELAHRGHQMIGVDPSRTMVEVARNRPGGDRVRWMEGDASRLGGDGADLVIMTGHVAQIIADDAKWHATLNAAHGALRPGGSVAFESRDPRAQPWPAGKTYASRRQFEDPVVGSFDVWQQVIEVQDDRVRYEIHYLIADGGEELISTNELRFRTESELTGSLANAGFSVEHIFGDWNRQPVDARTSELIYVATRT